MQSPFPAQSGKGLFLQQKGRPQAASNPDSAFPRILFRKP